MKKPATINMPAHETNTPSVREDESGQPEEEPAEAYEPIWIDERPFSGLLSED